MEFLQYESTLIRSYITDYEWDEDYKGLYEPLRYFLEIKGKNIRPLLALLSASLFEEKYEQFLPACMSVELFHNFSLIHDDIMDQAFIRRGKKTIHVKYNLNTAILSGDALLIKAYQQFDTLPAPIFKQAVHLFSQTALEVCQGQQLDIDFPHKKEVTFDDYLVMIQQKTAVLLAYSAQLGGILTETSVDNQYHLYQMALNLGIAFQLQDDLLDTFGDAQKIGKKIGGDILENKKTVLYIVCLEKASLQDKETLKALFETTDKTQEKIDKVIDLFTQNQIEVEVNKYINLYFQNAQTHLNALETKFSKEKIQKLLDFLINRDL